MVNMNLILSIEIILTNASIPREWLHLIKLYFWAIIRLQLEFDIILMNIVESLFSSDLKFNWTLNLCMLKPPYLSMKHQLWYSFFIVESKASMSLEIVIYLPTSFIQWYILITCAYYIYNIKKIFWMLFHTSYNSRISYNELKFKIFIAYWFWIVKF